MATCAAVVEYGGGRVASVATGFRVACRRAGREGVTPHTLRHTAAPWMPQAGRPRAEVAACLGDTVAIVEQVCVHHAPGWRQARRRRWSREVAAHWHRYPAAKAALNTWCCWRGLNSRPLPYQRSALPRTPCLIGLPGCAECRGSQAVPWLSLVIGATGTVSCAAPPRAAPSYLQPLARLARGPTIEACSW